jgi:hypothetical protein
LIDLSILQSIRIEEKQDLLNLYWNPRADHIWTNGAGFAILHENFTTWDSRAKKWHSVNMGPKGDVAGELSRTIKKYGEYLWIEDNS